MKKFILSCLVALGFLCMTFSGCATYKMRLSEPVVLKNYQELYDSVLVKKDTLAIPKSLDEWNFSVYLTDDIPADTVRQYFMYYIYKKNEDLLLGITTISGWDSLQYFERAVKKVGKK